ncbi:hypothetical protein ACWGCP_11160 [Streptomyces niveus]|uniref:hypothetical protein n=1 Tax=Streptomyces niveus TaxID=193462 RepID=UPI003427A131
MAASGVTMEASSKITVRGCKLHRRLIAKWVRALRTGLPDAAKIDFSTTRAITTYKSNSIDGLAEALADSTEPGDVEVVDNLAIFASNIGHAGVGEPRRLVRISISSNGWVGCHLSGDPSWVNAQTAVLRPLLEDARPRKLGIWYVPRWTFASWGGCLASLGVTFFGSLTLWILSTVAGAVFGYALGGVVGRTLKTEIHLTQDALSASYWRFTANEVITAVIALLAIAVAVIFGVTAHKDARKDDSGHAPLLVGRV